MSAMSELDIENGMTKAELAVLLKMLRQEHAELKTELGEVQAERDKLQERVEELSTPRVELDTIASLTCSELDWLRDVSEQLEGPLSYAFLTIRESVARGNAVELVEA